MFLFSSLFPCFIIYFTEVDKIVDKHQFFPLTIHIKKINNKTKVIAKDLSIILLLNTFRYQDASMIILLQYFVSKQPKDVT
jgi:hypothetical protein